MSSVQAYEMLELRHGQMLCVPLRTVSAGVQTAAPPVPLSQYRQSWDSLVWACGLTLTLALTMDTHNPGPVFLVRV